VRARLIAGALAGLALAACKPRDESRLASNETSDEASSEVRSLMDPALWEPAGEILSPVFPGTSAAWLSGADVWTLPGQTMTRAKVMHRGKLVPNHMQFGVKTKESFGAFRLSFEFRFEDEDWASLPPTWAGNSGIYVFGLYEVQIFRTGVFDARPVVPRNEVPKGMVATQFFCGSLYNQVAPTDADGRYVNLCADDEAWHRMTVTFEPARFAQGMKMADARVSVVLDGNALSFEGSSTYFLPGPTGSQVGRPEVAEGPLVIQDHGSRVSFRNLAISSGTSE
jgi:hypothetical protein